MAAKSPVLEVVVTDGPDEGLTHPLDPDAPVSIGRGGKGLRLTDVMVGLNHARIEWRDDSYHLVDTGEVQAGTHLADVILMASSRPVGAGTAFKVGNTNLEIRRIRTWVRWATFLGVVVVGLGLGVVCANGIQFVRGVVQGASRSAYVLEWHEPVRQGEGVASTEVVLDPAFLHARGLDWTTTRIDRVSDYDYDGIDELWLTTPRRDFVVTFAEGGWRVLGDLPKDCTVATRSVDLMADSFPLLTCPGLHYRVTHAGGAYEIEEQEGVVVWLAPPPPPREGGEGLGLQRRDPTQVTLARVSMRELQNQRMAGFLATRGVSAPVLYLVCEDAIPGVRAQALTTDGLMPLGHGCLTEVAVSGLEGRVLGAAFTAGGHHAMLEDLATFLSGNADALFATPEQQALIDAWSRDPGYIRGGSRLEFKGPEHFFTPIAQEGERAEGSEQLLPAVDHEPAPLAMTAVLLTEGVLPLDFPGCSQLLVRVSSWQCPITSGCTAGSRFLDVEERGCGNDRQILQVPYVSGVYDAPGSTLPVRVKLDVVERQDRIEVLVARLSVQVPVEAPTE